MQFVKEYDFLYIPEEQQDGWVFKTFWFGYKNTKGARILSCATCCFVFALHRDSDEGTDKAELLHSNNCLRTLYTDLQKAFEMLEDSNVLLKAENNELKNQLIR